MDIKINKMRATLKFTLPDEQVEYEGAVNGSKMAAVILDIDNWLRAEQKHEGKESLDIELVRTVIRDTLANNDLNLDMMMFY